VDVPATGRVWRQDSAFRRGGTTAPNAQSGQPNALINRCSALGFLGRAVSCFVGRLAHTGCGRASSGFGLSLKVDRFRRTGRVLDLNSPGDVAAFDQGTPAEWSMGCRHIDAQPVLAAAAFSVIAF